ncbi:GxxExxY protein [Geminisphaera colitermitum]|uniref:GxxExxY protein n=1 Tax=Geminisphaera colitermitum TaxID=1148786 RepID=UPI0001965342|nr:GxxExxY protein [Geminisphaera colitermitum]
MHPLCQKADAISNTVIGAAIEVHRDKGPGLIESIYERCLVHELSLRKLPVRNQGSVRITYKDFTFEDNLRFDILVDECLLLEGKCVEKILPIHKAQLMSYMKLLNIPLGILFNYNTTILKDDMHRLILPGANLL